MGCAAYYSLVLKFHSLHFVRKCNAGLPYHVLWYGGFSPWNLLAEPLEHEELNSINWIYYKHGVVKRSTPTD